VPDHQSILLVLNGVWGYSGLIIVLAVIGALIAVRAEGGQRAALLVLLGCTTLVVPAAQLHDQTGWALDKHLAYGIWFAAIAAGYACSTLIRWLPGVGRQLAAVCCVIALAYPAVNSWKSAWEVYHAWPDASSFITNFTPAAALSGGLIYVPEQEHIAEYYTSQGREWARWNTGLSLDLVGSEKTLSSDYTKQLQRGSYGIIVLFYATTFSSAPGLNGNLLLSPPGSTMNQALLKVVGKNSGEPGLQALTLALVNDSEYHLTSVGPYDSAHDYGSYAIWQKVQT
jgi:hypothetical protein